MFGGAALITSATWKVFYMVLNWIQRCLFTIYVIPKKTPQYKYFVAWLQHQPVAASNVMELSMGVKASSKSVGQGHIKRLDEDDLNAPEDDNEGDMGLIPSLGSTNLIFYNGCYLWISTGSGTAGLNTAHSPFPRRYREAEDNSSSNSNEISSYPSITVFGKKPHIVKAIIREGRKLVAEKAHKATTIFTALLPPPDYGDPTPYWVEAAIRPARKLESIVLPGMHQTVT